MNPDDDIRDIDKNCIVCGSWTRSHRVPDGYACHTCWTEKGEQRVILALDAQVLGADLEPDERVQGPPWAGGKFRLDKSPQVAVVTNAYDFEAFPHAIYCQHPSTTLPVELAADGDYVDRVFEQLSPTTLDALP